METQLRRLHLLFLLTILNPNMFYTISIDPDIKLQGKFNGTIVNQLRDAGYKITICQTNGYVLANRNNINITLTE